VSRHAGTFAVFACSGCWLFPVGRAAMIRSAMMTILYPEAEVFSAPVRHDEPRFVRGDDGLGTVTQPELAQHATDVGLHGLFRDHEAVRNLDV